MYNIICVYIYICIYNILYTPAVGPEGWGRPNREGHRRRRRGARGGGRLQGVPDELIKNKEKTEMRETTGNPDQTGNLAIKVEFLAKTENDPTVNTSISVVGFRQKQS